jgi:hypothetical protein
VYLIGLHIYFIRQIILLLTF